MEKKICRRASADAYLHLKNWREQPPYPFSVYGPVGMCRKEVQNVTLSNELLTFEIRDIRFINWQVKLSSGISMTFTTFLDIRIWWAY